MIITTVVGLYSSRLLLQALGVSDYGLFSVVGGLVSMMGFLNTVMITTTYRYIAVEIGKGNIDEANRIFNVSFAIHASLAVLLVIIGETIGVVYITKYLNITAGNISDALFVFRFSIWGAFFSIITVPYQGLITAQEKFLVRASIEILRSLFMLAAVILVAAHVGNKLRFYSILSLIVMIIPSAMFIIYNIKYNYSFIRWNLQRDINIYKELLSFSGWIMIGAAAWVGKTQGSALIINSFFGTVLNATFGIASQVNNFVSMFARNLSQAAIPQIMKNYASGNDSYSSKLTLMVSKYSFFLMLLPAFPILLHTEYLLKIWLVDVPDYTVVFVRLNIVYALLTSLDAGIPALVQASGKIKWFQAINSSILLTSLPIAYVLFSYGYKPYFIIITYIVSYVIIMIANLFLLNKLISFNTKDLISKVYCKALIVVLLLLPLFYLENLLVETFFSFFLLSIIAVLHYLLIVWFFGVDREEKIVVINFINQKILFR